MHSLEALKISVPSLCKQRVDSPRYLCRARYSWLSLWKVIQARVVPVQASWDNAEGPVNWQAIHWRKDHGHHSVCRVSAGTPQQRNDYCTMHKACTCAPVPAAPLDTTVSFTTGLLTEPQPIV